MGDWLPPPFQINDILELIGEEQSWKGTEQGNGLKAVSCQQVTTLLGHQCPIGPADKAQTRHRHPAPAPSRRGILGVRCLPCLLPPWLALVPGTVQMNEFLKLVLKGLPAVVPLHSDDEGDHGTHLLLPPSLAMSCV